MAATRAACGAARATGAADLAMLFDFRGRRRNVIRWTQALLVAVFLRPLRNPERVRPR